jgi:hypothetical protein
MCVIQVVAEEDLFKLRDNIRDWVDELVIPVAGDNGEDDNDDDADEEMFESFEAESVEVKYNDNPITLTAYNYRNILIITEFIIMLLSKLKIKNAKYLPKYHKNTLKIGTTVQFRIRVVMDN